MKKWKELSNNEKIMIGFAIILLIILLLNWKSTVEGIKKGFEPYNIEKPTS